MNYLYIFLLAACISAVLSADAVLENDHILFEFNDHGGMNRLYDKKTGKEMVSERAAEQALVSLHFVNSRGMIVGNSTQATSVDFTYIDHSTLLIIYSDIPIGTDGVAWATLRVKLDIDSILSKWNIVAGLSESEHDLGLWEVHMNVPVQVGSSDKGQLFFPSGLGQWFQDPYVTTGGAIEGDYPSGGCSMQYMALADDSDVESSGVYVGAEDPEGFLKLINYNTIDNVPSTSAQRLARTMQKEAWVASEQPEFAASSRYDAVSSHERVHLLSIVAYVENSGMKLPVGEKWKLPYDVAVGIVRDVAAKEGKPLWYQASQLYRPWVTKHAKWTQKGLLSQRVPSWYRDNSIWLNSHWQCLDVFNSTGGDPAFVSSYTKKIADKLNQPSLAYHWYEWQQGPDPAPDARYLFDTHYPDYFPARAGFSSVMKDLEDSYNIHSLPYINGRIFDINSDSYLADNGEQYCTKSILGGPRLLGEGSALETIIETYGSNATFCVANPSTQYWKDKIIDTSVNLIEKYGSAGVYIDQIGAAKPYPCWDVSMGHTLGGGTYWTNGYSDTLAGIKKAYPHAPIVTEDCAETYMDNLDGYLVLTTYKGVMALSPSATQLSVKRWNPAFAAVYGGYYIAMGAEWMQQDFLDHDWWRGKLAATFSGGTQMGWFSLAGTDNGMDHCGPMGVGDKFLDPANADLVDYLRLLAAYRRVGINYIADGRLASPVKMKPEIKVIRQTPESASRGTPFDFDSVSISSWHHQGSTLSVFAVTTEKGYFGEMRVDFLQWGYDANDKLEVTQLVTTASDFDESGIQRIQRVDKGIIQGPYAWLPVEIHEVNIVVLEFTLV